MKKIFEIEWNDDLGKDWMNIFNLELCLFSKEHTKRELVRVKELISALQEKPFKEKYGIEINGKWTPLSVLPSDINKLNKLIQEQEKPND